MRTCCLHCYSTLFALPSFAYALCPRLCAPLLRFPRLPLPLALLLLPPHAQLPCPPLHCCIVVVRYTVVEASAPPAFGYHFCDNVEQKKWRRRQAAAL